MSINSDRRIVIKVFALLVMVFALLLFSKDWTKALLAPSQTPTNGAQLPTVTKADQEGAPLRIIDVIVEAPSPDRIVVRVVLQNQSDRKIRALAVAAGARLNFLNLMGRGSLLSPTHTKTVEIIYVGGERPKGDTLSVDFVEFSDGTTWGIDAGNSQDRLAGQREGAKAEKRRLKNLLHSKGRQALVSLLEEDESRQPAPPDDADRSQQWRDGYRGGAAAIRYRVRQALRTSNREQVGIELNKPYDTSEDNNQ